MNPKYILLPEKEYSDKLGEWFYRLKAIRSFGDVREGDLGGLVQDDFTLSHEGTCWVYSSGVVVGDAKIYDDAKVFAIVTDDLLVYGKGVICE